ncbi:MAG: hypothetical protein PHF84_01720 [bacterium]|nr:hypothetical protein [bacterium]
MKKVSLVILALLMLISFSTAVKAQTDAFMYLNITIVQAGLNIASHFSNITWGVGNGVFTISSSNVKGTIENTGTDLVDLQVKCTNATGWTPSTTTNVTASTFCLQGVFCPYNTTLAHTDFATDDIITSTLTACGASAYARPADPAYSKGMDMPSAQVINMRFRFKPPTGTVNGTTRSVTVRVRGVAG